LLSRAQRAAPPSVLLMQLIALGSEQAIAGALGLAIAP
jgi:hypothetical protein